MVDEKTSTRALTGQRMMHKNIPKFDAQWDPTEGAYVVPNTFPFGVHGWIPALPWGHYYETYLDTSGYTLDSLTTMPINAVVQEAGRYQVTFPESVRMLVVDLITTERIDDMGQFVTDIRNNNFPSFDLSRDEFSTIIYGRFREFTGITQGTVVQDVYAPVSNQQFGSLEATTADKIWIYKVILLLGIPAQPDDPFSTVTFPASRFILNAEIVKEGDLPYLMRQKRSYELTNY